MPSYLPNAVIMNLRAGVCDSTSQAEMRDLTIMFISLPNLNLKDNIEIQSAIVAIQEATYQVGWIEKISTASTASFKLWLDWLDSLTALHFAHRRWKDPLTRLLSMTRGP